MVYKKTLKTYFGGLGIVEAWILCIKTGPHSIKLTMQKLKFPLELPTINHNIVCEKTILVVVS